jgi:hypothetical protein
MFAKFDPKVGASPKGTILPLLEKNNWNLKFAKFFRGAMFFGKYLQPHNINNQKKMQQTCANKIRAMY